MSIKTELSAATKLKPKRGEDEDDFRQRLVAAVSDLDDKAYAKLTKSTKSWADGAIETFNDTGKVPAFSDEDEEVDEDDDTDAEDDGEEDEHEVKPSKTKKKKPTTKKKVVDEEEEEEEGDAKEVDEDDETETDEEDEDMQTNTETSGGRRSVKKGAVAKTMRASNGKGKKKVAAAPAGRKTEGKSGGGQSLIKQLLARDPDMSIDDLEVQLKKKGHEMSRMTLSTQRSGFRHTVKVLQEAKLLKKNLIT